jgi:hypothetical protein
MEVRGPRAGRRDAAIARGCATHAQHHAAWRQSVFVAGKQGGRAPESVAVRGAERLQPGPDGPVQTSEGGPLGGSGAPTGATTTCVDAACANVCVSG